MEENGKENRMHISKMIEAKLATVADLKATLEQRSKTVSCSLDDQIQVTELEYQLVQEEMALLSLQEQHWESAALWDTQEMPDIRNHACEALYSYITTVKENGAFPALHASEHFALENGVIVTAEAEEDATSLPVVEWADESTGLEIGDRLLEVNGQSAIGKDQNEINQLISAASPVCKVVFLRPVSMYQLLKNVGCKETSNLRNELTSVVCRLNHKMVENSSLKDYTAKLESDVEDLKMKNQKLKLQVLSLHNILLFLYHLMEDNIPQAGKDSVKTLLFSKSLNGLKPPWTCSIKQTKNLPLMNQTTVRELIRAKSSPWFELTPVCPECMTTDNPKVYHPAPVNISSEVVQSNR